jgi:diphthamide synthase (EF-2-diphthine--ammonia ligase)
MFKSIHADLKPFDNINFSSGEYESFVYDGPIFKKRIDIEKSEVIWEKIQEY